MGKLNSFIKFVVFNANALLFLGGVGIVIVASLLLAADFIKLAQTYMHTLGIITLMVGILVAAMSVIGCIGTNRQIERDRLWSGRRILSLYQLILVAVVVGQGVVQMRLYSIEVSLEEAAADLPNQHGEFEGRFREGFNEAYFEQLCSASAGGDSWVWSLVEDHCPDAISRDVCSCSDILDGSGLPGGCSTPETYSAEGCCPDEEFCEAGKEEACPYAACRTGILEVLLSYITPARRYSTFVFVLEGMVLILTCLLICYNPRDSTEDILIKTGTIMRQHHKPGEGGGGEPGSQAGDLEGTPGGAKNPAGASIHALRLDLVQPAGAARRAGAAGKRGAAGGSPGRSTPAMSPMAVENIPTEPLSQFLTPRRGGNRITYGPDSGGGDDGETYEYQNPRKGKSAAVGPPRAKAKTATTAAAAAVAATATAPGSSRAAQEKRQHGAGAAAIAPVPTPVARLLPGAAPSRRHGEEKRSQERNHSYDSSRSADDEEEKKRDDHGCEGIMADMTPVSAAAGVDSDGREFYQRLGAQTPAAQYGGGDGGGGGGIFATSRTSPTPTGAASPLDSTRFLTETSSVQATAASRYFPHGGGGSFQVPQSPITPAFPGSSDNGNAEKLLRLNGQTNILTSPMSADVPTSSGGGERTVVPSSSGLSSNPRLLSQQTPVASPRGGLPPTYQEHTDKVGNAAHSGSPASAGHSAGGDSPVGDPTGLAASLANALLARANAGDGASPTNISENQQQEEEAGNTGPSSTPAGVLKGLMTQTPPGGVSPARPERTRLQRQLSGSAAYSRSGSDLSPVLSARGTPFQVADFPEEEGEETPSPLPVVEPAAKSLLQVQMSTAGEGSRMFLGQTPITLSNADATRLYESTVSTDTVPMAAAGATGGGAGGEERASNTTSGRKVSTSEQQPVVEDGAPSPVVEPPDQARASPPDIPLNTKLTNGVEEPAVVAGRTPSDGPTSDDATTPASATAAAPLPSAKPQSRFARFLAKALSTDVAAPAEALSRPAAEAATVEGGSDGINGTSGDPAAAGERKTGTETGAHPVGE